MFEDGSVIAPTGLREVDDLVAGPPFGEELTAHPERPRAGDSLQRHVPTQRVAPLTEGELGSLGAEGALAPDGCVLFVELLGHNLLLGCQDGGEHEWLAGIVSVRTHTEVHLLGVGVPLKCFGDTKDGVRGSHLDPGPEGGAAGQARCGRPLQHRCTAGWGEHHSAIAKLSTNPQDATRTFTGMTTQQRADLTRHFSRCDK